MPAFHNRQRFHLRVPAMGLTILLAALALPAGAQDFVSSNRTVAGGNPMSGSYSGQSVFVGASGFVNGDFIRVMNVQVDIVAPAQLNFSDVTGGRLDVYSNSVVRVTGGTFGGLSSFPSVGRTTLADTSRLLVSGGSLRQLSINGAAPAAGGASAVISGGSFEVVSGATALVQNGTLTVDGGSISQSSAPSGQPAVGLYSTGTLDINGGSINSAGGAAVHASGGRLTMTGGTVSAAAGGGGRWGIRLEDIDVPAALRGGTVNGGIRTTAASNQSPLQAVLGGTLAVNGGVFAYGGAALNVTGGSYTRFSGADASFFTLGTNTINFFGTDLALSGPTAGSVFETNTYSGNFYTFTSGTFSDGQSAIGLKLFDAVGSSLGGGFTLNPSPVPEPRTALLLLMALPAIGVAVRRRCRVA